MADIWPEVATAKEENRRELNLHGSEISERIEKRGFDKHVFDLVGLNYLDVRKTCLAELSVSVSKLVNLNTLILHNNRLTCLPETVGDLKKLKLLDVSSNKIESFPKLDGLTELQSLNASGNQLSEFPDVSCLTNLHILNLSHNELQSLPDGIGDDKLEYLAQIMADNNAITQVPADLANLVRLHTLDLSFNKITELPPELSDCQKLKEFNVKGNKFKDRKLTKLVEQSHGKSVLNFLGVQLQKVRESEMKEKGGKDKKKKKKKGVSKDEVEELAKDLIDVLHFPVETGITVQVKPAVISVRPYFVSCIVRNLNFKKSVNMFKRFITLQTKLHDTICNKRHTATIATHDLKLVKPVLVYDARFPHDIKVVPLFKSAEVTAATLVAQLRKEADDLRKEKKRNTYSGIHKYLDLLKDKVQYPCLLDGDGHVISFPPITNSDKTKISKETTDILVEVTSTSSLDVCKKVADELLREMLLMGVGTPQEDVTKGDDTKEDDTVVYSREGDAGAIQKLVVEQVRVIDHEGTLKVVYPSRTDLPLDIYEVNRE
ncbi:leucine-rich repeat-containing protein 47-like isoform X1 [Haliotis rubra]|uniref:leucine-rich repeat-containing protein 47-like isoform X1 n=1 Tax=Haliotis rubra TaxID=36100 RepID=UPI001EE559F3|nr:leucine-rich repeat-containing protein 47-like isoform X1 [Haliotis rubra]